MKDLRMHLRSTVVKGATLFYNNGNSSVPCVVLDQSETGAKIQINSSELFSCPETFQLRYLNIDKTYECCRMWSDKGIIGLKYIA